MQGLQTCCLIFRAKLCIKGIETEASQQSPLSLPIHAQIRADLGTVSTFWRARVCMANYTLTALLLFSAGAILVNLILYMYFYKELGEKERMTQKASANGSYSHGLAFVSRSVCFSKHACTIEILLIKCW